MPTSVHRRPFVVVRRPSVRCRPSVRLSVRRPSVRRPSVRPSSHPHVRGLRAERAVAPKAEMSSPPYVRDLSFARALMSEGCTSKWLVEGLEVTILSRTLGWDLECIPLNEANTCCPACGPVLVRGRLLSRTLGCMPPSDIDTRKSRTSAGY